MRRTALSLASYPAALCASAFFVSALCASGADAAVVTGSASNPDGGSVVVGTPPGGSVGGDLVNLADVYAFDERAGVALTSVLTVLDPNGVSIALPIGLTVDSHYIEWDPSRGQQGQATVAFSGPILGILVSRNALTATDARFGRSDVTYIDGRARGVEVNGSRGDSVAVLGNVLTFDVFASLPDGIRVFTLSDGGTGPAVPLPGAAALMLTGLAGMGAARRRSARA